MFITIGQTAVVAGLNSALIQRKDITEDDYSIVMVASIAMAVLIYIILFLAAPFIAKAYSSLKHIHHQML